jgi:hypothetical protein
MAYLKNQGSTFGVGMFQPCVFFLTIIIIFEQCDFISLLDTVYFILCLNNAILEIVIVE